MNRLKLDCATGYLRDAGPNAAAGLFLYWLTVEWVQHNVAVNTVALAFTWTPLADILLQRKAFYEDVVHRIQMGHIGEVDEVVGSVLFLASDAANWVTG